MHMSCLISLNPMNLENIAHVGSLIEKSEEPCRILKKFECVVNVIHAKVLPVCICSVH